VHVLSNVIAIFFFEINALATETSYLSVAFFTRQLICSRGARGFASGKEGRAERRRFLRFCNAIGRGTFARIDLISGRVFGGRALDVFHCDGN